ncbi:MAG: hypothetical protein J6A75_10330 [Lachnospiraceae bacterium]|nr:hypothetical protein [Lachnospiraceae bacterium]
MKAVQEVLVAANNVAEEERAKVEELLKEEVATDYTAEIWNALQTAIVAAKAKQL